MNSNFLKRMAWRSVLAVMTVPSATGQASSWPATPPFGCLRRRTQRIRNIRWIHMESNGAKSPVGKAIWAWNGSVELISDTGVLGTSLPWLSIQNARGP